MPSIIKVVELLDEGHSSMMIARACLDLFATEDRQLRDIVSNEHFLEDGFELSHDQEFSGYNTTDEKSVSLTNVVISPCNGLNSSTPWQLLDMQEQRDSFRVPASFFQDVSDKCLTLEHLSIWMLLTQGILLQLRRSIYFSLTEIIEWMQISFNVY